MAQQKSEHNVYWKNNAVLDQTFPNAMLDQKYHKESKYTQTCPANSHDYKIPNMFDQSFS